MIKGQKLKLQKQLLNHFIELEGINCFPICNQKWKNQNIHAFIDQQILIEHLLCCWHCYSVVDKQQLANCNVMNVMF